MVRPMASGSISVSMVAKNSATASASAKASVATTRLRSASRPASSALIASVVISPDSNRPAVAALASRRERRRCSRSLMSAKGMSSKLATSLSLAFFLPSAVDRISTPNGSSSNNAGGKHSPMSPSTIMQKILLRRPSALKALISSFTQWDWAADGEHTTMRFSEAFKASRITVVRLDEDESSSRSRKIRPSLLLARECRSTSLPGMR